MLRLPLRFIRPPPHSLLRPRTQSRFCSEKENLHTVEKPHDLDVQTKAAKDAMKERQNAEVDPQSRGQKKEPEKEFKKAPQPIIGMQDERGKNGA
ncbi:hypothetical protein RUND412_003978 [Rhizina undulata]